MTQIKHKSPQKVQSGGFKSAFGAAIERTRLLFIIYSAYSVICLILGILLSLSQVNESFFGMNDVLSSIYNFLSKIDILGLALGLVGAIWLFAKYTNYCSDNLVRSLPANDRQLFSADFLSGFLTFVVPIGLGLGLQTLAGTIIESTFSHSGVFSPFGISYGFILNFIFGYCIAVLCFSLSKGVLESVITYVLLNFIPSIVYSFTAFFRSAVLGANPVDEFANTLKMKTTYDIIANAISGTDDVTKISYIQMMIIAVAIIGISVLLTFLAYFAFTKLRSPEKSESKIKSVISITAICLISFYCGFLILFFKRTGITLFNAIVIIPTMIIASFIVYFIANTIINRTIRIPLKKFLPYTAITAFLLLIGIYYFTCGFGQADYIPVAADVESVTINYMDSDYQKQIQSKEYQMFDNIKVMPKYDFEVQFPVTYSDYKSIYTVIRYQNDLLNEYAGHDMVETTMNGSEFFKTSAEKDAEKTRTVITYKLKNGKTVSRYYNYNGSNDTMSNLSHLNVFDNSVTETESRAKAYVKKEVDSTVSHTIYITPIASDNQVQIYSNITDEQLKKLTQAILDDENSFEKEDLLGNENGDVCILQILPAEKDEDNPYFSRVYASNGNGYCLFVKTNYKNVLSFIKNDLNAKNAFLGMSGKDVKQLFVGKMTDGSISTGYDYYDSYQMSAYKYSTNIAYNYDYYQCTRFYNTDTIKSDADKKLIDGEKTNAKAVDFLLSKAKLLTNVDGDTVYVLANTSITTPFHSFEDCGGTEERTAYGKILMCVSGNDYKTYLSMLK